MTLFSGDSCTWTPWNNTLSRDCPNNGSFKPDRQAVRPGREQDLTQPQPPRCALPAPAQRLFYLPPCLPHFTSFPWPWSMFAVIPGRRGIFLRTDIFSNMRKKTDLWSPRCWMWDLMEKKPDISQTEEQGATQVRGANKHMHLGNRNRKLVNLQDVCVCSFLGEVCACTLCTPTSSDQNWCFPGHGL